MDISNVLSVPFVKLSNVPFQRLTRDPRVSQRDQMLCAGAKMWLADFDMPDGFEEIQQVPKCTLK